MRILVSALIGVLLGACAAPSRFGGEPPAFLFKDDSFIAPPERFRGDDLFAVNDSMRHFLAVDISHQLHSLGLARGLVEALYTKGVLRLAYDTSLTRNAAEAFDARAGNCLSLVIMTAAFAKELGLPVQFRAAYTDEVWSRSGDLLLGSGHVNVTLGSMGAEIPRGIFERPLTVDFLQTDEISGLATREISEATVVAMYMNNKAVEALVQGQLDDAYGWARAAVRQDPAFVSSYNTLGVIYERRGNTQQAVRVFSYVIDRQPDNVTVLSNLADALSRLGQQSEAASLRQRLARLDPHPPYYFFNLGMTAMQAGDFQTAKSEFAREVDRADYNSEFHYWLGAAYFKLGEVDLAQRQIALALERSSTSTDRDLYAAKLAWLHSHETAAGGQSAAPSGPH
jgi:Flp pilus assembly protein TadD